MQKFRIAIIGAGTIGRTHIEAALKNSAVDLVGVAEPYESGGEQKQLEIGRALLLRPKVLLIDEPSIGLSPIVVQDVFKLLRKLVDQGTTILMVEQNVKSALKYSDDAIALESGRLVLHQSAAEILADPEMDRLFLGASVKV
jgi:branched-chain amino acid transport system ATP-binding protein